MTHATEINPDPSGTDAETDNEGFRKTDEIEIVRDDTLEYEYREAEGPKGAPQGDPVMQIRDLNVSFASEAGAVRAVRGLNFDLWRGHAWYCRRIRFRKVCHSPFPYRPSR